MESRSRDIYELNKPLCFCKRCEIRSLVCTLKQFLTVIGSLPPSLSLFMEIHQFIAELQKFIQVGNTEKLAGPSSFSPGKQCCSSHKFTQCALELALNPNTENGHCLWQALERRPNALKFTFEESVHFRDHPPSEQKKFLKLWNIPSSPYQLFCSSIFFYPKRSKPHILVAKATCKEIMHKPVVV